MTKLITFILEHDSQGTYLHVWTRTTQDHLKMKLLSKTNPNIQALKIEIIHKANLIFQALKITVIQKANLILRAFKIDNICKKYNQRWRLHRVLRVSITVRKYLWTNMKLFQTSFFRMRGWFELLRQRVFLSTSSLAPSTCLHWLHNLGQKGK